MTVLSLSSARPLRPVGAALAAACALVLGACGSAADLDASASSASPGSPDSSGPSIVVGSQDYYSNEILAEVYAQALEAAGYTVDRQLRIGQREVYMPELQQGAIDVFPEYTGNLLQYLVPDAPQTGAEEVAEALASAMPEGLRVLDQAEASDQDSYVVTADFAREHSLTSIGDLAGVEGLVLGGNSELETRPYGPRGLASTYGVSVGFTPIEDSGGSLTVKALRDGDVQLVDIYSSDPVLADPDLVVLEDPQALFLSSRVIPVVSDAIDDEAAAVLNRVSAALGAADLVELNRQSTVEGASASQIAARWLESKGLVGAGA
ncbi:ABC transporter substrate-binding protein [Actinomyces sp. B33]|uniref:ABC transporter substrate-binding protein n=1 Tax=Actinomyces sp. B33 TaxID=2942131 RepID=UPI0023418A0C|nr:ABC transporter substrate-binding protein [Actinomyces sp. B33]MDC4232416.1 ABC transporter substrate-binding protein [Actinomyces sp. B33]